MPDNRGHIITEHTEEAQQILGRIPSWIVRWGVTVIFAVFALILIGCCIIKYPERVTATVTITTGNSPVDVVAGGGGNLERILVSSGDSVSAGGILGVIRSSARWEDVLEVERRLKETDGMPPDSLVMQEWVYAGRGMGDIQSEWSAFSTACRQLREASDYARLTGSASRIDGLGHGERALCLAKGSTAEYTFDTPAGDSLTIDVCLVPTHAVEGGRLRFRIATEESEPQTFDCETREYSEEWKAGILQAQTVKTVSRRSPNEWIENYVTMELRALLRNTTKSVKEIAKEMNFPNQSFLGKYFKEHVGMSPVSYRKS